MIGLAIWGASGHAKVVADIVKAAGEFDLLGFLEDSVDGSIAKESFLGLPVFGGSDQIGELRSVGIDALLVGFGDCRKRMHVAKSIKSAGFQLATAVHPSAVVAPDVSVGEGTVIAAGVVVNPGVSVGTNVILNTSCSVDHDCHIGDGAHICPGVRLAGSVEVGKAVWIGIGSIIRDGVTIGSGSYIGAGSLVLKDIPSGVLAYGSPADPIRTL